jgi:hypothetical protein
MQRPGRFHGTLNEHLPCKLQQRFKIKLPNKDEALIQYFLALVLTPIHEDSSNLDPISKFVQVSKAPAAVALHVFRVGNIGGCVHVIPQIVTSSMAGDGWNARWIVNCQIDLATSNDLNNK